MTLNHRFGSAAFAFSLGFTAVIFLFALGLFLYARAMRKRGVLV